MNRPLAIVLSCLVGACASSQPESEFVRITADTGRVYYANHHRTIHSESGGFLTFRDLITKESVRLKNGTYVAKFCPRGEVEVRQVEYLRNPTRPPRREDYEQE
ncbi:MAG: hypothetical protein OER88_10645 [Planctomycetota bacterium]|nr:hypothetical protein [Planctomycetota bacterium]